MTAYYLDYIWEQGKPLGLDKVLEEDFPSLPAVFKLVSDPYGHRLSIEYYLAGSFSHVIYDSHLMDFRRLREEFQTAWRKEVVEENTQESISHIRDENDRLILFEHYFFESGQCRKCLISSPHDIKIGRQQIYHARFGDPFNGVILWDNADHPVMLKKYALDEHGVFSRLIEEDWAIKELSWLKS